MKYSTIYILHWIIYKHIHASVFVVCLPFAHYIVGELGYPQVCHTVHNLQHGPGCLKYPAYYSPMCHKGVRKSQGACTRALT